MSHELYLTADPERICLLSYTSSFLVLQNCQSGRDFACGSKKLSKYTTGKKVRKESGISEKWQQK
jgi:hypothetical protein